MIVLDFGNGSVCGNDRDNIKRMIDGLAAIDPDRQTVIKWQLFLNIPPKLSFRRDLFDYAYKYAADLGYMTTASVFDADSLDFLLRYRVPFIKLANMDYARLYWDDVPRSVELYVSVESDRQFLEWAGPGVDGLMACVSKYPADVQDYYKRFTRDVLDAGISDHTTGIELYRMHKPALYEKHFVSDDVPMDKPRPYCARPEQVRQILEVANACCNDAATVR